MGIANRMAPSVMITAMQAARQASGSSAGAAKPKPSTSSSGKPVRPTMQASPRSAAPTATQAGGTGGSIMGRAFPKDKKKPQRQLGRALTKRTNVKQGSGERKTTITHVSDRPVVQQNPLAGRKHMDDGGLAANIARRMNMGTALR